MTLSLLNSYAMAVVIAGLMVVCFVVLRRICARWIMAGFELLLFTLLLRRLDEIASSFGCSLIDSNLSVALSWLVILVMAAMLAKAYQRRRKIRRVEAQLRERERGLEMLRRKNERGMSWDRPVKRIM